MHDLLVKCLRALLFRARFIVDPLSNINPFKTVSTRTIYLILVQFSGICVASYRDIAPVSEL